MAKPRIDEDDEDGEKTHKRPPAAVLTPEALEAVGERDSVDVAPVMERRIPAGQGFASTAPTTADPVKLADTMATLVAGDHLTIPDAEWAAGGVWFVAASALLRRGKHVLSVSHADAGFLVVLDAL